METANTQLTQVFEAFNELSVQLAGSYKELERRVESLTRELAEARSERLEQLAEKERLAERLTRLIETLPGGVLVINQHDVICEVNRGALDLLGEPLLEQPWSTIKARAFLASDGGDAQYRLHDGRAINLSCSELGQGNGCIVLLQDVSEMRALQEQVHRDRRLAAMGEMAASLAHQIRTPLASAVLYASQLDNPQISPTQHGRFTERLLGRLRYLETIINDMLIFARGGALGMESISSTQLIEAFRLVIEPQLATHGGQLHINDEAPGYELSCNCESLLGALENLAINALQACAGGAVLELDLKALGTQALQISLSDNGPGIPKHMQDRIFDPFFTTRQEGTGLGLAVVSEVARAHGGEVRLEHTREGGARFVLRLPLKGRLHALPSGRYQGEGKDAAGADAYQLKENAEFEVML